MNNPVCPICQKKFPSEDYCPKHGVALAAPELEPTAEVEENQPDFDDKEQFLSATAHDTHATESIHDAGEKLSKFMSKLGLRHVEKREDKSMSYPENSANALPDDLVEKHWGITGPVFTVMGIDSWPVERNTSGTVEKGAYHRFRTGALTQPETYKRLMELSSLVVPNVMANGTVDMGGARTDFELVSDKNPGMMLDKWFANSEPSEERAQYLLRPLSQLLTEMSSLELQPIVLEASLISIAHDGQLALTSVGAISELQTKDEVIVQYRPEFVRSALLPQSWAAPEVVQQSVLSNNAAVFSVGQLLAQAVWGQCITHAELQAGALPFNTLSDARIANILKGCLWPKSKGRWTHVELEKAIHCTMNSLPDVNAWASLVPGASSTAFGFAGESYWRLEDLLHVAVHPQHWDEAIARIKEILLWAESTSWAGQSKMIFERLELGKSADHALIALCSVVNPKAPPSWRDLNFVDAQAQKSLGALAQRALKGSADANATVLTLFQSDLRGAFNFIENQPKSESDR